MAEVIRSKRKRTAEEPEKMTAEPEKMVSEPEKIPFETGVSNLLDKMNGIPQGTKEVFLWELVCNSASALHILGRRTMYRTDLIGDEAFSIVIIPDKGNNTLSIVDNGTGMKLDDLKRILLNIPEPTLKQINVTVDEVKRKKIKVEDFYWRNWGASLGFFAAYMVADKVEIITKHYVGDSECRMLSSASERWCSFKEEDREAAPVSFPRGTTVTLHLNKDYFEYLEESRLKVLIDKTTFDVCPYPVSIHVQHPLGGNFTVLRRSADLKESKKDLVLLKRKFEPLRRLFRDRLTWEVDRVVVSDRIYDLPSFLSVDRSTLEINPRNWVMEELRLNAEKNPKDKKVLGLIYEHYMAGLTRIRLHGLDFPSEGPGNGEDDFPFPCDVEEDENDLPIEVGEDEDDDRSP